MSQDQDTLDNIFAQHGSTWQETEEEPWWDNVETPTVIESAPSIDDDAVHVVRVPFPRSADLIKSIECVAGDAASIILCTHFALLHTGLPLNKPLPLAAMFYNGVALISTSGPFSVRFTWGYIRDNSLRAAVYYAHDKRITLWTNADGSRVSYDRIGFLTSGFPPVAGTDVERLLSIGWCASSASAPTATATETATPASSNGWSVPTDSMSSSFCLAYSDVVALGLAPQ